MHVIFFIFPFCGIFNLLAFISQELLALKEAKHYHFSFYAGVFNAASSFKREKRCHSQNLQYRRLRSFMFLLRNIFFKVSTILSREIIFSFKRNFKQKNYLWVLTRKVLFLHSDSFDYVISNVTCFLFRNSAVDTSCYQQRQSGCLAVFYLWAE